MAPIGGRNGYDIFNGVDCPICFEDSSLIRPNFPFAQDYFSLKILQLEMIFKNSSKLSAVVL